VFGKKRTERQQAAGEPTLRCSFCNKSDRDVRKLIAGPAVFICDECVQVCVDIIAESARVEPGVTLAEAPVRPRPPGPARIWCALCRMPLALDEALLVADRGLVCGPCVSAVEATALAARDASQKPGPVQ
jgi:ClpX C4-type zinc finger